MTLTATHRLAFAWASVGVHVFPVGARKKPAIKAWQVRAVGPDDLDEIIPLFGPAHRVGIATGLSRLLVIDFDVDPGSWHLTPILPDTYSVRTPRGGWHFYYTFPEDRNPRNSNGKLAEGIDVRANGGYVVAYGAPPMSPNTDIAPAPAWLIDVSEGLPRARLTPAPSSLVAPEIVRERAVDYLMNVCPEVSQPGVDPKTYQVCLRLRDLGVPPGEAYEMMRDLWNEQKCDPPWDPAALHTKVQKAYKYAKGVPGEASLEPHFLKLESPAVPDDVDISADPKLDAEHPLHVMNRQHAWVLCGNHGRVLWDRGDRRELKLLSVDAFHQLHAPTLVDIGGDLKPLSRRWMGWRGRRTYSDLVFNPRGDSGPDEYNLWNGFACDPATTDTPLDGFVGVKMWLELVREIYCRGDDTVSEWLLGYFAHMVQRPWEKPLVGIVLRSDGKGTGKNAGLAPLVHLLGSHGTVVSRRRYVDGNFNAHMERALMLVLDEAFWVRGSKESQAVLQDLITGQTHFIERKGLEAYPVPNLTRVFMLSNNDWVIPASADERRYAVFDLSEARKQDRKFFTKMRVELTENGGDRWLLRYLLDRPMSDVNFAPRTAALKEQMVESLDPIHSWWLDCLEEGRFLETGAVEWPAVISKENLRQAIYSHYAYRGWRGIRPSNVQISKSLMKVCPYLTSRRVRSGTEGFRVMVFEVPTLERCRELWERYCGGWTWGDAKP